RVRKIGARLMPFLYLIGAFIGAIVTRLLPWLIALSVGVLAVFSESVRDLIFQLIIEFIGLFFVFLDYAFPDGSQTVSDFFNQLPGELLVLVGHLQLPLCVSIIVGGLALRILRKLVLRF
ncbi:MAG: hypothetical protein AAF479_17985, partial [Pseudomonadota bacterium]